MAVNLKNAKLPDRKKLYITYRRYRPQYENALLKLNRRLKKLITKHNINTTIKYRVKTFDSYFEKLLRQRDLIGTTKYITDIMGIRIICPFLEDLDVVEQLISKHFTVLEVERKGLKHSFREFGYDSIHMLIALDHENFKGSMPHCRNICEVQLRSILQEAWAEVEHELIYKANVSLFNASVKRKLASLNAILTLSDVIFQEIRDYQKQVQIEGLKLRESLQAKALPEEEISLMDRLEKPVYTGSKVDLSMPMQPQSTLEKLLMEALNAHSSNRFEKAIKIYSRILRMKTNSLTRSIIYNHRGMAHFVISEYQRSLKDFSRAYENDPNNFRALNNRGLTYRMLGNLSKALDDLNRSLEINNSQVDGYYIRALIYYDIEDFSRSLKDCEEVLNLDPDYQPAIHLKKIVSSKLFI